MSKGISNRPKTALGFRAELQPWLFPGESWRALQEQVDLVAPPLTENNWHGFRAQLYDVEILIGSWGIPVLDAELLAAMPRLRAVLYGAGSVRGFTTEEFWRRGIVLSSAVHANAKPTAAFAEAMIVLALKHTWFYLRRGGADWAYLSDTASSGVHGATVGIVGLSRVGRAVVEGLRRHELNILVSDPTLSAADAQAAGVELVELAALFSRSDVVSMHAPLLPATVGMIGREHFELMPSHATFVNTARGALVRERELIQVMRTRTDLTALLDVTDPEPAPADSPLRALPNVVITPHLAGARHREIELVGRVVLEELQRFLAGQSLRWALDTHAITQQA